jgi:hypothetical protein
VTNAYHADRRTAAHVEDHEGKDEPAPHATPAFQDDLDAIHDARVHQRQRRLDIIE